MYFMMNEEGTITTRTNYNLVDVLSNTGGIASVITIVFYFLTMRIQKLLFQLEVMRKYFMHLEDRGFKINGYKDYENLDSDQSPGSSRRLRNSPNPNETKDLKK